MIEVWVKRDQNTFVTLKNELFGCFFRIEGELDRREPIISKYQVASIYVLFSSSL